MNALIISASPRVDSSSIKVARAIQRLIEKEGTDGEIIDFLENDIPGVGRGSLDPHRLTAFQRRWVEGLGRAELVICVVPEYNWMMPGEWIDALHQTGVTEFAHLFHGRVFAVVGVSSGRGGRRPAIETHLILNKLISFLGQESIVAPAIFESHETGKCLNEKGESLGNALYDGGLQRFVNLSLRTARRWTS
jgi:chromate reductase